MRYGKKECVLEGRMMKLVNPEIMNITLIKGPEQILKDKLTKIICDKYGIEGDSTVDEMINDICDEVMNLDVW